MNRLSGHIFKSRERFIRQIVLLFMFACALVISTQARAEDLTSGFEAANKLYEEGKYSDAAAAYDKLLAGGKASEAIYFNRGNAWFKAGQVGRAIASYREALWLAPRDSALRENLQLARTRARGGSMYRAERWKVLLGKLSLNEWTVITSVALWAFFILLAVAQFRPGLKLQLRNYVFITGAGVVLFGLCFAISFYSDYNTPTAIVTAGEVEVRNGPLDESVSIFKVRDGAELEVADQKDGWLQVVDPAQRIGWLPQNKVIVLEAGKVWKPGA
ncbi:MAG TPA: SH3 domain-containing protein [Verrucomicrobiae bacterium]|jgi:tetratricopeptide (TPR) repeat protein|nr:SH3 domain-containing protein [Verrucomicrobiae bacterium]